MEEIEILDVPEKKQKPKKKKKKTKKIYIILILILLIAIAIVGYWGYMRFQAKLLMDEETRINNLISDIKSHYSESVIVSKDTDLIESGSVIGTIYKDSIIELNDIDIDENTKYFSIKDLNYNISYKDVSINDETPSVVKNLFNRDDYYKNYIVFNKNINTNDSYSLYDEFDNKIITLKKSDTYKVIINNYENKYYGVEYNNRLLYIKDEDIKEVVDSKNTDKKNTDHITTLCYHRVNLENKCTDSSICIKQTSFDKQMKYLKDNNYLTITMEDMYMYIKGYAQFEKAVLVTLDDGWGLAGAIQVFEKYGLHGISFSPTYRIEDKSFTLEETYNSDTIEVQSHTHNMHRNYVCSKSLSAIGSSSQGGAILCESEDSVRKDLTKSIELIENLGKNKVIALAYPFYDYNDRAIKLLQETGFKMGFIGIGGKNGKSSVGTNQYKVPRITLFDTTSFDKWKGYL